MSFSSRNRREKKNLTELKKSVKFKKFDSDVDSVNYDDLDNYDYNYDTDDGDKYRNIESIRRLFKGFDRNYFKPIKIDDSFDEKKVDTQSIRAKEIDMKIYHKKNILI